MRNSFLAALTLTLSLHATTALALPAEFPDPAPNFAMQRNTGSGLGPGHVAAFAPHPQGGMIVGGDFVIGDAGAPRTYLLRVLPDGTLDPAFNVEIASSGAAAVHAVVADATGIYIGGAWQTIDGVARPTLAKLELDGDLVAGWNSGLTANDEVYALALGNGSLYAGGGMVTDDIWGLAKYSAATGARDVRYRAQTQGDVQNPPTSGSRGRVYSLQFTGADLIVGGVFGQIAGVRRRSVARLALEAPLPDDPAIVENVEVLPYNPGLNLGNTVRSIARDPVTGQVYLGGLLFVGANSNLLRTNDAGVVDTAFKPNPNQEVSAMALVGDTLYFGGYFRVDSATPLHLARTRVAGNGTVDPTWLPVPNLPVRALAWQPADQRLWVGGQFTSIDGMPRVGLARFSFGALDLFFQDGFER